jgi:sulfonate transport system ATP-binding protein
MSDTTKVQVRNLTKKFDDLLVLNNVSFDVERGDLLCVVGPTGCGKTTFLNSLTKIYDITSGEILVDGTPVDTRKNNISYIFQGNSTMPWLNVEKNISFGLDIKYFPDAIKKERMQKYLDIVGLTKFRKYYPHQLSASML